MKHRAKDRFYLLQDDWWCLSIIGVSVGNGCKSCLGLDFVLNVALLFCVLTENIGGLAVEHKRMEQWGKNKEGVLLNGEHRTGSRSVESLALLISRSRRHAELRPTKKGTTTNEKWEDSGWTRTYSPCTPPRTDGRSPFSCLARWRRRTTKNRTDTIHVYQPTTR